MVFVSGVEMWNVTPSKSETVWSIDAGGALVAISCSLTARGSSEVPRKALGENRLNQHILVVEEKHRDGVLA